MECDDTGDIQDEMQLRLHLLAWWSRKPPKMRGESVDVAGG